MHRVIGAHVEPERAECREQRRVALRVHRLAPDARCERRHDVEARIRLHPRPPLKRGIILARGVALREVRPAVEHLREPMPIIGRPCPECDHPRALDLAHRGDQCGPHRFGLRRLPLRWLIGEHKQRREPVRPLRVAPDAAHPRPSLPILDRRYVLRILDPPALPIGEIVPALAKKGAHVLEDDFPLHETRRSAHDLSAGPP